MLRAVEGKNLTWQVEEQRHYLQRPHEQDPLLAGGSTGFWESWCSKGPRGHACVLGSLA